MGTLKVNNLQKRDGTALITDGAASTSLLTETALRNAGVGSVLLNTTTITSSTATATIDSSILTSDYDGYDVFIGGVSPVTDSTNFQMKVSYDNGSSFFTDGFGGGSYNRLDNTSTAAIAQVTGATQDIPAFTHGNADYKEKSDLHLCFYNTKEAGVRARLFMQHRNANTYHYGVDYFLYFNDNQIMNHLTFLYASGNISTAVIKVYGRT